MCNSVGLHRLPVDVFCRLTIVSQPRHLHFEIILINRFLLILLKILCLAIHKFKSLLDIWGKKEKLNCLHSNSCLCYFHSNNEYLIKISISRGVNKNLVIWQYTHWYRHMATMSNDDVNTNNQLGSIHYKNNNDSTFHKWTVWTEELCE